MTLDVSRWEALKRRFDALIGSYELFDRLRSGPATLSQAPAMFDSAIRLGREMLSLRQGIVRTRSDHDFSGGYFATVEHLTSDPYVWHSTNEDRASKVSQLLVALSLLRNDLDAFFHDGQEAIRLRAERAFLHLQWSIASTPSIRDAWKEAFKRGETQCESMGATHLLMHGIYAFKVSSSHARTDLVFNEPVDTGRAAAVADGLVLTEWKRVKILSKVEQRKVRSAAVQADHYATGVLGGIELRRVRYVVLVSEHLMSLPADEHHDDHVVRFINIAVDPESPSAAATAISGSKPADSVADAQA